MCPWSKPITKIPIPAIATSIATANKGMPILCVVIKLVLTNDFVIKTRYIRFNQHLIALKSGSHF